MLSPLYRQSVSLLVVGTIQLLLALMDEPRPFQCPLPSSCYHRHRRHSGRCRSLFRFGDLWSELLFDALVLGEASPRVLFAISIFRFPCALMCIRPGSKSQAAQKSELTAIDTFRSALSQSQNAIRQGAAV